jgi:hypothetical protein
MWGRVGGAKNGKGAKREIEAKTDSFGKKIYC